MIERVQPKIQAPRPSAVPVSKPSPSPAASSVRPARTPSGGSTVKATLKELIGSSLKLSPESLEEDKTFTEYGVDSLLVMELTKKLSERYGTLDTTVLFEYDTISSLSTYLEPLHQSVSDEPVADHEEVLSSSPVSISFDSTPAAVPLTSEPEAPSSKALRAEQADTGDFDIAV
ncbi:acyl carrier protein, partial [Fulvivirga kasyanovii]|nr:acyl carrier protein [Fulvivirga kasyanovii]